MKKNKGAALANIMLISAFVMIMASTIISIAYKNYKMKLININTKNNFYACEAMLDEFRVGFRNMVTQSTKSTDADRFRELFNAYELDGVKYTSGTPKKDGDPTLYDVGKIAELISIVNGKTVASINWKPITINGVEYTHAYETNVEGVHVIVSATADYMNVEDDVVGWYSDKIINGNSGESNLVVTNDNVKFSDITVTYEKNGYINSISTDINVGFVGSSNQSFGLDTYSLMSYGGLDVYGEKNAGDSATLVIEGNMYLEANGDALVASEPTHNSEYTIICTGNYIVINGNLVIKDGAKVCFPNAVSVYIDGNISIDNNDESGLVVSQDTKIYVSRYESRSINEDKIYTLVPNSLGGFDKVKYNETVGVLSGYSGNIPNMDYDQIIVKEKDFNGKKIGYNVQNFFSNTNMKNQNPLDGNYVDIATGGTWRTKFWQNSGDDKAGLGIFTGAVSDRTAYNKNIRALVISEEIYKIRPKYCDIYNELGIPIKCIYMKPLGDRYYDLLNVKLNSGGIDYTARDIFVDVDMKLGGDGSDKNESSKQKTLSITYSNWARE